MDRSIPPTCGFYKPALAEGEALIEHPPGIIPRRWRWRRKTGRQDAGQSELEARATLQNGFPDIDGFF
jgi:hypothetical protein